MLHKSNKRDYTSLLAYRLILLLSTFNKAIELPIADQITYLSNKYILVPRNHFGGLKCKNTVNALVALQKKIY